MRLLHGTGPGIVAAHLEALEVVRRGGAAVGLGDGSPGPHAGGGLGFGEGELGVQDGESERGGEVPEGAG